MERRKPLQRGGELRRTPLNRGTSELRRAPMKRTSAPMPRSKPLDRGAPIAPSSAPEQRSAPLRRTPLARQSDKAKAAPKARPARKPDPITPETRAVVLARCAGMCEACGDPLGDRYPTHFHHRQPRQLGDHSPANIVALHSVCHVIAPEAVHQNPEWARERGLIVRRSELPAAAPLTLPTGRRVLLDPVGPSYVELPEAA